MQPVKTWNMCMPVMPKKVAPKSGVEPGQRSTHAAGSWNGFNPSVIRWFHSIMCSTIKVAPSRAVAIIHMRTFDLSRRAEAETAITIVKLEESSTSVITDEKTMLG